MKSKGKLFLFHWHEKAASARAAELAGDGWPVEMEFEEGSRGCRNLKAFGPDIVVLDTGKKASHSREVGRALRQAKSHRETPFVFVDGTDEEIFKVKEKVPAAIFTTGSKLTKTLAKYRPPDGLRANDKASETAMKDRKKAVFLTTDEHRWGKLFEGGARHSVRAEACISTNGGQRTARPANQSISNPCPSVSIRA
jgi:hypothetical protein